MAIPGWAAREHERIEARFTEWAASEDAVRAAVVIGSRARGDHRADEWADLDILVLTDGSSRYVQDPGWVASVAATMDLFGEVSRRTAAALGMSRSAAEEHARALVDRLRPTRPARS